KKSLSNTRFEWKTNWEFDGSFDGLPDGNITINRRIDYKPKDDSLKENDYYNGTIYYKSGSNYNKNESFKGNIIEYGKKNDDFSILLIDGNGKEETGANGNLALIGNYYIDAMGQYIKDFEEGAGIKSYIIGYASTLTNSIKDIGDSIDTEPKNRYVYNSTNFNLDEIFKNIATDIMADFWLAAGPQIKKGE
ncbi:MAG: hypothetical protein RBT15_07755, partial [Gudongella sp.]|nr:hypothetical protein [Gudongella sp.]